MWGSDADADVGYANRNIRDCWLCEHILYIEVQMFGPEFVDTMLGLAWYD